MGNNQCIGKRYENATQSVECIRRRKSETKKNVDETSLDCFSEYRKRFKKTYNPASKLFEEDFYSHKEAKFSTAFEGSQDIRSCKISTKCNTQRTKVKFADQFGLDKGVQDMKLDISGEEESYHVEDPFLLKQGIILNNIGLGLLKRQKQ
ncbi:unnamed protein product [Moneuplotes crassus]|uniref:Uncharacterized protein n=1 Tax=Euplotes crassus TaxID=5936 RepID=A0AAD1X2M2_EUPCR|nr:unnamed protein product [Moneuplotes crassus]